jgi:lysozyme family protein
MTSAAASDRFSVCLAEVLRAEGGFNDIPQDRGGATNFGISMRFLVAEVAVNPRVRAIVPPPITRETIRALTVQQAGAIYRLCFWAPVRADDLPIRIDHAVFCMAVNAGVGASARLLQRAMNSILPSSDALLVDGRIGPRTLAAAARLRPDDLLRQFRQMVTEHYQSIVRRDPSQRVFLRGWLNRAARLGRV